MRSSSSADPDATKGECHFCCSGYKNTGEKKKVQKKLMMRAMQHCVPFWSREGSGEGSGEGPGEDSGEGSGEGSGEIMNTQPTIKKVTPPPDHDV